MALTDLILARLRRWNITISALKSSFGKLAIKFLGHKLSGQGLQALPKDVEAFIKLPFPRRLVGMQSFLGCLNFYSRFIQNYSQYASCLYELTDGDLHAGINMEKAQIAFDHLKHQYATMPLLIHAKSTEPFHIVLYPTQWAVSATVCQLENDILRPIRFCGRTLKGTESRYEP